MTTDKLAQNLRFFRKRELLGQWEMDELFELEEGSWDLFEMGVMPESTTLKAIHERYRVSLEALLYMDLTGVNKISSHATV
jgi:hypothetical protein